MCEILSVDFSRNWKHANLLNDFLQSVSFISCSETFMQFCRLYISIQYVSVFTPFLRRIDGICRQVVCAFSRASVHACVLDEMCCFVPRTNGWTKKPQFVQTHAH